MTAFRLQTVEMLHLLWLAPLVAGFAIYAAYQRAKAVRHLADETLAARLTANRNRSRRVWKSVMRVLAIGLTVFALSRPAWNPKPRTVQSRGRDVVFVLDVSKSMLAEDLAPNRLERAKLAILDCVEKLEGDRVGLVAFAGAAAVKCPMTLDYGFFRMMLDNLHPDDIARGGTLIGDALRVATEDLFGEGTQRYRDVVLITDGEDHESYPVQASSEAGKRGIRLIAIGLGDESQGQRIPIRGENGERTFLTYNGQEVWTKLDAATLREMAAATPGGRYLNVATGAFDLGAIYRELIASAEKTQLEATTLTLYEEKFQVFIALALVCLSIEWLLPERKAVKS